MRRSSPAGRSGIRGTRRIGDVQAGGPQECRKPDRHRLRRQLHQRRQQLRAGGRGLAADLRPLIGRQIVQRVADLRLDEAALLLHHQQRALAAGELAQALDLQRPGHRDLVERDLRMVLEIQHAQRMHRILVRAPDGDDADRRVVAAEHAAIEAVGARPGEHRRNPLLHHAAFQLRAVGREAQIGSKFSPCGGTGKSGVTKLARRRDDQRGRLFGRLGGGLQRDPQSRKTATARCRPGPGPACPAADAGFSTGMNTPSNTCSV